MSRVKLLENKALYEKIIAQQHPDYFYINAQGKQVKPSKTPWMIPVWEKGLAMVNELLQEGGGHESQFCNDTWNYQG